MKKWTGIASFLLPWTVAAELSHEHKGEEAKGTSAHYHECLVEVCGKPSSVPSLVQFKIDAAKEPLPPAVKDEIEGLAHWTLAHQSKETLMVVSTLESFLSRIPSMPSGPSAFGQALLNWQLVEAWMDWDHYNFSTSKQGLTWGRLKPMHEMTLPGTLSKDEKQKLWDVLSQLGKTRAFSEKVMALSQPPQTFYRTLYPTLTYPEAVARRAEEVKALWQKVEALPNLPKVLFDILQTQRPRPFPPELSEDGILRLEEYYYSLRMVDGSVNDQNTEFTFMRNANLMNGERATKALSLSERLQRVRQEEEAYLKSRDRKEDVGRKFSRFLTPFYSQAAQRKDVLPLQAKADGIAQKILGKLRGKLSEDTYDRLRAAGRSIDIAHGPLKENFVPNLKRILSRYERPPLDSFQSYLQKNSTETASWLVVFTMMAPSLQAENSLGRAAESIASSVQRDHFTAVFENNIWLSNYTIQNPDLVDATLAHEFGHYLAHRLRNLPMSYHSAAKFMEARACFSLPHRDDKNTEMLFHAKTDTGALVELQVQESRFAEEDWADAIGTLVSATPFNRMCPQLKIGKGRYVDETFTEADAEGAETHSSPLFMTLHHEFLAKGKLPLACTQALALRRHRRPFTVCF